MRPSDTAGKLGYAGAAFAGKGQAGGAHVEAIACVVQELDAAVDGEWYAVAPHPRVVAVTEGPHLGMALLHLWPHAREATADLAGAQRGRQPRVAVAQQQLAGLSRPRQAVHVRFRRGRDAVLPVEVPIADDGNVRNVLNALYATIRVAAAEVGQVAVDIGDQSPHVAIVAGHRGK